MPALSGKAPLFARALKPWLKPKVHRLIACSRRMQGLMVRKEHAELVHEFADLVPHRLRFVNRQPGSGTRLLVEHLIRLHALEPRSVFGTVEHIENTHVAVGLCIASGVVDAGVGIEAAAVQFGLHFVPLVEESYFLACLESSIQLPAVRQLREILAGPRWRGILAELSGYRPAAAPGSVLLVEEVLPWSRRPARRARPVR